MSLKSLIPYMNILEGDISEGISEIKSLFK
jgi:hypothetical protein